MERPEMNVFNDCKLAYPATWNNIRPGSLRTHGAAEKSGIV
jgi:hypothetical protein